MGGSAFSWCESSGPGRSSGNHLPNPIPPRVRRHSSSAQSLRRAPLGARTGPSTGAPGVHRSMHEPRPYGNGCCLLQAVCPPVRRHRGPSAVTRRRASRWTAPDLRTPPPQGARRAWTFDRVPTFHPLPFFTRARSARAAARHGARAARPRADGRAPAGLGERRGPLGRVQLRAGPCRPCRVRRLTGRRHRRGARPRGGHGSVPAAPAAVRAGRRATACRTEQGAPRTARQNGCGGAQGHSSKCRQCAVGLTNSHTRSRMFSANFRGPSISWPNAPSTPVRPGLKDALRPPAPYGDRPRSEGALPSKPPECNAS